MAEPITLSETAAQRLQAISAREGRAMMLRVAVEGGGCSGFQYRFDLTDASQPDDLRVERDGAVALVDDVSVPFLGGAVFLGPYSPVAAGDYVAGPSHCLPTNTTARFSSGISVHEFLKRMSVERYDARGLAADAEAIETMALAEGLDAHAASVRIRRMKDEA